MLLKIKVKKSFILLGMVAGLHAGGVLIAFLLPLGFVAGIGLATIIIASWWRQWREWVTTGLTELEFRAEGVCLIRQEGCGETYFGRLVAGDIHPACIRLTLKATGQRSRVLLVMRDAIDTDTYRELRADIVQGRLVPDAQAAT
jgi:hypothetical protein